MTGKFAALICCAVLLLAHANAVSARSEGDRVYVNEMLVLTLRASSSSSRRAASIADRLMRLDSGDQLTVRARGRSAQLMNGEEPILTISSAEAEAGGSSAEGLANSWLENLRRALALPALVFQQDSVRLQAGAKCKVAAYGSEVLDATVENSDPGVVEIGRNRGVLSLRAKTVGESTVTLVGNTSEATLRVRVLPLAARLPQTVELNLTGDPCTAETVRGALEGALLTRLDSQPGATMEYTVPTVAPLPMSGNEMFSIPVKATAPDAFPVEGLARVAIRNVPIAFRAESELWYCNDPESVRAPRKLFASYLKEQEPVRMLYHHINDCAYPLAIEVRAVNHSDSPAQVLLIPGDSVPDRNPVLAGFQAGDTFLRNWIKYSGELVTIPPRAELPIALRKLYPKQTMSGLCYLRLMGGGPSQVLVRTDAYSAESLDPRLSAAFKSATPWRVIGACRSSELASVASLSREIYPTPFKTQDVEYRVGGRYGFVRIGQKPIASQDERERLEGNFGVLYTIHVKVINPTPDPVDVEVVFESSAGYSAALFVVNGSIVRTPIMQSKEEAQITHLKVDPGESWTFTILTCPLSGSSYPATITVRPASSLSLVNLSK